MKLGNPSGHNVLDILWRPRVSWLEDEGHAGYSWFLLPILICWMLKGCPCSLLDGCCHKDSHFWMFGYFQENLGVLVLDSCILFYFCLFKESHNWQSMINLISFNWMLEVTFLTANRIKYLNYLQIYTFPKKMILQNWNKNYLSQ